MATNPAFADSPKAFACKVTGANTTRDLSSLSNAVELIGTRSKVERVERVVITAAVAIATPGMARMFLHDGSAYYLFREILIPVDTVGANDKAWSAVVYNEENPADPLINLPATWRMLVSSHIANELHFVVPLAAEY